MPYWTIINSQEVAVNAVNIDDNDTVDDNDGYSSSSALSRKPLLTYSCPIFLTFGYSPDGVLASPVK